MYNLFNQSFKTKGEIQEFVKTTMKNVKMTTTPTDENFDFLFDLLLLHKGQMKYPHLFIKDNISSFEIYRNKYLSDCLEVIYKDGSRKEMTRNIQKLLSDKYTPRSDK